MASGRAGSLSRAAGRVFNDIGCILRRRRLLVAVETARLSERIFSANVCSSESKQNSANRLRGRHSALALADRPRVKREIVQETAVLALFWRLRIASGRHHGRGIPFVIRRMRLSTTTSDELSARLFGGLRRRRQHQRIFENDDLTQAFSIHNLKS